LNKHNAEIFLTIFHTIGQGMLCAWGREEACTGFCWGNLSERDHWGDPGADRRIILIFRKLDVGVWTGSSWLKIGTGCGHL